MFYTKYIIFIVIIIILFILLSHYLNYTQINHELIIQQSEHPINDVIDKMLAKKQPTIFRYEMELWDGFDLLLGQQYEDIIEVMKKNKVLESNVQQIYLKPYELPLTKKWNVKCHKTSKLWNELSTQPICEKSYLHLISCISGLAMICLISPRHTGEINKLSKSNKDIKQILVENTENESIPDNKKWEYITIPLRPSNMIYIPYGWNYYIYSGVEDQYCVLFDAKCITYFN
jgi:hypothetical protein